MSIYNGPPRGGTRGGKDQFSWDNVKGDKDRDFYLGHSVKAPVGRWQKGKDLLWYTKGRQDGAGLQDEVKSVKQREQELMMEALGLKPKSDARPSMAPSLEQHELDRLLKGSADDEDKGEPDPERIKGLGYSAQAVVGARGGVDHETLQGVGVPAHGGGAGGSRVAAPAVHAAGGMLTADQLAALDAADRRAAKKAKKEAKQAKKDKKGKKDKKKKEKHQYRAHGQRDDTTSSSDGNVRGQLMHTHGRGRSRSPAAARQRSPPGRGRSRSPAAARQRSPLGRGRSRSPAAARQRSPLGRRRSRSPAAARQRSPLGRRRSRSPVLVTGRRQRSSERSPAPRPRERSSDRRQPRARRDASGSPGRLGRGSHRAPPRWEQKPTAAQAPGAPTAAAP